MNKILLVFVLFTTSCNFLVKDSGKLKRIDLPKISSVKKAVAVVRASRTGRILGKIKFTENEDRTINIAVDIKNIATGRHGFHIHQYGDLTDEKFNNVGSHFNPNNHEHSTLNIKERHIGDLGNIVADEYYKISMNFNNSNIKLSGPNNIIGRTIIIHQDEDDGTGKVGNAGKKVAGGIIGIAK